MPRRKRGSREVKCTALLADSNDPSASDHSVDLISHLGPKSTQAGKADKSDSGFQPTRSRGSGDSESNSLPPPPAPGAGATDSESGSPRAPGHESESELQVELSPAVERGAERQTVIVSSIPYI